MKYSDNVVNIIALKQYKGIGNSWISKNIHGNETIEDIVYMLNSKSNITSAQEFSNIRYKILNELLYHFV